MSDNDDNRRAHRRVPLAAPATLTLTGKEPREGTLCNLSLGGAFIGLPKSEQPRAGSGLLLSFRLPGGFHVRVHAKVAWCRTTADAEGPAGIGVQFLELDGVNREFIGYHLRSALAGSGGVTAEVFERYRVLAANPRLSLHLRAALTPAEGEVLDALVAQRLQEIDRDRLILYLEAIDLAPSSRETLVVLRRCLGRLAECSRLRGVIVGPNSTGMVQLRRLARDVGIADSLVSFDDPAAAQRFCASIESE